MMVSKLTQGDSQVSTMVRAEVHSMLKQHATSQSTPLRFYIEAGMILTLNKTGSEVKKIIESWKAKQGQGGKA